MTNRKEKSLDLLFVYT